MKKPIKSHSLVGIRNVGEKIMAAPSPNHHHKDIGGIQIYH